MYQWQWLKEPVVLALIGAMPGALRGLSATKRLGVLRALSDVLIGLISAASVADWLTPEGKPMTALLIGMVAGMIGARALDAMYAIAPDFVREYMMSLARRKGGGGYGGYEPLPPVEQEEGDVYAGKRYRD